MLVVAAVSGRGGEGRGRKWEEVEECFNRLLLLSALTGTSVAHFRYTSVMFRYIPTPFFHPVFHPLPPSSRHSDSIALVLHFYAASHDWRCRRSRLPSSFTFLPLSSFGAAIAVYDG